MAAWIPGSYFVAKESPMKPILPLKILMCCYSLMA